MANLLRKVTEQGKVLQSLYRDEDGARRREIEALQSADEFKEFDKQLRDIKNFHQRYPNQPVEDLEGTYSLAHIKEEGQSMLESLFTGEEAYGRFVDLTNLHEEYLNLKSIKRITYLSYILVCTDFTIITKNTRNAQYLEYLHHLQAYLVSFLRRTQPLRDLDGLIREMDVEWQVERAAENSNSVQVGPSVLLSDFHCAACQKSFAKDTVYQAHLASKKHKAKEAAASVADGEVTNSAGHNNRQDDITHLEFVLNRLGTGVFKKILEETRDNVERKQSLTERERQMELEQIDEQVPMKTEKEEEEEKENEEFIWNPLKLPLGWDGKPIPFWLWKLHGLGVEYPCEICGGKVINGRKNFEKHFQEANHLYGLRCLGIQPSPVFKEITRIDAAVELWNKLKADKRKIDRQLEQVEEMEDKQGNVMSRKLYQDLKRQGLVD